MLSMQGFVFLEQIIINDGLLLGVLAAGAGADNLGSYLFLIQPPEETNTNTRASANMDTHGTNTNTVSHNSNDAPTPQSGQTI